jgi:symplekin
MRRQRPETNETSLALVPADHPILKPQNLESEAHGLLDRALGILQENYRYFIHFDEREIDS